MFRIQPLTLIAALLAVAPLTAQEKSDLPIQRVVMFNSGVSFFEHGGKISGDATVDLKFDVADVNDLLKSMVLQDLGGGKISTVTYASRDPITRTLETFSIDLTGNPALLPLCREAGGDVIGVDWRIGLREAWDIVGHDGAVQGNLDPVSLMADLDVLRSRTLDVLDAAGNRPGHIFNLGHGVLPGTLVENVKRLVEWVHEWSA